MCSFKPHSIKNTHLSWKSASIVLEVDNVLAQLDSLEHEKSTDHWKCRQSSFAWEASCVNRRILYCFLLLAGSVCPTGLLRMPGSVFMVELSRTLYAKGMDKSLAVQNGSDLIWRSLLPLLARQH